MIKSTEIKVRGYHLDLYGHVNNARYLEFLEEARWALLEGRLNVADWQRRGIAFFAVNININYRKPADLGDVLEFYTGVSRIGNKSATVRQEIRIKGSDTIVADADITFVIVDVSKNKALPLDGELRELFDKIR